MPGSLRSAGAFSPDKDHQPPISDWIRAFKSSNLIGWYNVAGLPSWTYGRKLKDVGDLHLVLDVQSFDILLKCLINPRST